MTPVLQINHLSKHFGIILALDDFSLTVDPGTVYGILGPNGSGKTTLLSTILGILHANGGNYEWFGKPPSPSSRRRIGSLLEKPNFLPYLSAVKNLKISADVKGAKYEHIPGVLEITGLSDRKHSAFQTFSFGMKQRLALAAALLGDPDVLVLDEPTNGLDPRGIFDVREVIQNIAGQGKTIILASHILDEIEKICTHVAILKKGKKLDSGLTSNILAENDILEIAASDMELLLASLSEAEGVINITTRNDMILAAVNPDLEIGDLNAWLVSRGIKPYHLVRRKKTLESYYMKITGK